MSYEGEDGETKYGEWLERNGSLSLIRGDDGQEFWLSNHEWSSHDGR